jgi:hypothetical protein
MPGRTTLCSERDQSECPSGRLSSTLCAEPHGLSFFSFSKSRRLTPIEFRIGEPHRARMLIAGRAGSALRVAHLHAKSGSLTPPKRFVFELRDIVLL